MNGLYFYTLLIVVPLIFSNSVHMLIVKKGIFSFLEKPLWIWGFGENKTARGFLVLPVLNGIFSLLCFWSLHLNLTMGFLLGILLGLAYLVFELPNSFLKRRLGIGAGEYAQKTPWFFLLLDKLDSAIGVVLVAYLLLPLSLEMALQLLLVAFVAHLFFSFVLVLIRIKKTV